MRTPQHIAILGSGESGTGAALLAKALGMAVWVSDLGLIPPVFRRELEQAGIPFEEGGHTLSKVLSADLVVKSPGIPPTAPPVREALAVGIPVWGEIEFAYRHAGPCKVLAITGSNGKTTTTALLHHLLVSAGLPARLGGNIGHAFARLAADDILSGSATDASRIFVLETSSFQLEDVQAFRPHIAMLLNITPDHLDRYAYQMEAYAAAKFNIAKAQTAEDLFLFNADDAVSVDYLRRHPLSGPRLVSLRMPEGALHTEGHTFHLKGTALRGPHNAFNALFALTAAIHVGADPVRLQDALRTFAPPAHRMEPIAESAGVTYINDSKATNVDAVYYALSGLHSPVVWIAGGQDKGNNYETLLPLVANKVRAIVCLGADNTPLHSAFGHLGLPMTDARSAAEAVAQAASFAAPGTTVLLSPACASFDLFRNYMDRGEQFRSAVQQYIQSGKNHTHVDQ